MKALIKPKPKMKPKLRPKPVRKVYPFDALCNRLQHGDLQELCKQLGLPPSPTHDEILTEIGRRVHLSIYTSMGSENIFVAKCSLTTGSGYLAAISAPLYSIKSSSSLIKAATISFVQLCKQLGRF